MGERVQAFTIVLDKDMHEDDAAEMQKALYLMRGVISVEPVKATPGDWMARERVRHDIIAKLLEVLK